MNTFQIVYSITIIIVFKSTYWILYSTVNNSYIGYYTYSQPYRMLFYRKSLENRMVFYRKLGKAEDGEIRLATFKVTFVYKHNIMLL